MAVDWSRVAKEFFDKEPHPRGHGLKIGEFATAVRLATILKFGGHAEPQEAAMFWQDFAPGGVPIMPPQDFEHAIERIAPLSYVYHGRPPSLKEIVDLAPKASHEMRRYFADLPDRHHPDVSAGEMVKAFQAARPWARQHLEREPVKSEAHYLHHSGERPEVYYARLAAQNTEQSGLPPQVGGDAGGRSLGVAGRSAPDQRAAGDQRGGLRSG